jgi:hypothetical protein
MLPSVFDRTSFDSKYSRSALLVTDSEYGHFESLALRGTVVSVGGAKYGDILNVFRSNRYDVSEYAIVGVCVGMNCFRSSYVESGQRRKEFKELKNQLKQIARERSPKSVLFACSFNHPEVLPENRKYMDYVAGQMRDIGVECLNWNEHCDPFIDQYDHIRSEYFEDKIHLNMRGSLILYKFLCKALPKLRFIECTQSEERVTLAKRTFERFAPTRNDEPTTSYARDRSPLIDPKDRRARDRSEGSARSSTSKNVRSVVRSSDIRSPLHKKKRVSGDQEAYESISSESE